MSDDIKLILEQTREKAGKPVVICRVTVEWFDMADWEANTAARDIVTSIVAKTAEWDKALTGGPPTK